MSANILIVDDSGTMRALIKRTIKLSGLPVGDIFEAANGRAALELMRATPVELVLADLNMPEMSGFEMTRQMQEDDVLHVIPVVIISAEPNAEAFAKHHPGVKGCLKKPFTPEGVRNALTQLLGGRNAA